MNLRTIAHRTARLFDGHKPLVEVSVSRKNLLHNLRVYREQYPDLDFATVLKSNAYGHGLETVARILDKQDLAFFMVDSYFEARALKRAGIRTPIVILGYVRPKEIAKSRLRHVDYGIVDIDQLRKLSKIAKKTIRIHIKIDTGMHRHGITPEELRIAIKLIRENENLEVVGACSHLADADNPTDQTFSHAQIEAWNAAVEKIQIAFPTLEYRHIAATKGIPLSGLANANVARLGIGLYGFDTSPDGSTPLKPVMELRSIISSIRTIEPGESVGYNVTYSPSTRRDIATVPIGYFEGVDRRQSNKGYMLVNGVPCPIVGRISMNMSSIDVTDVPEAKPGDDVVAISRESEDPNSVSNIAKLVNTPEYCETEYVILVHVAQTLRRVVE